MLGNWLKGSAYLRKRETGKIIRTAILLSISLFFLISHRTYAYDTPEGYSDHDYQKLVAFLELPNGTGKNGDKMSANYDPQDPTTWAGVSWDSGDSKRVDRIVWDSKGLVGDLNVRGCTVLEYLYCNYNQLTALDVSGLAALEGLFCYSNELTALNVSGCTALTGLNCSSNTLTELDVSSCSALTGLSCSSNKLTVLDLSGFTALKGLSCYSNELTSLNVSGCTALTQLYCYSNRLTTLDVSYCTALTDLSCYSNQLTSLNVSGFTALTDLSCFRNELTSLDVSGCPALEIICCYYNELTTLDLSDCTSLARLLCQGNKLTSLDVSGCAATLTSLSCGANKLTSLDVGGCAATLTYLSCYSNNLTVLDVSDCEALTYLGCGTNKLTALNVSGCNVLAEISCYYNELTFTTLPVFTGTGYHYFPQNEVQVGSGGKVVVGNEIDLSSEAMVDGVKTVYTWYKTDGSEIVPATSVNGVFSFDQGSDQAVYCEMTNTTFPALILKTIKISLIGPAKPTISIQPQNVTAASSSTAAFSVTAEAADSKIGGVLSYQWQLSKDGGSNWSDIKDSRENSYTTAAVAFTDNGLQYRCIVTNTKDKMTATIFSNPAILTIVARPPITSQPRDITVLEGATATFSVTAEAADSGAGGVLIYQWQLMTDSGSSWSDIDGATTNSYTTPAVALVNNDHQYRCQVINVREGVYATVFSNPATLSVIVGPIIVGQPGNITVLEGATATFSITAEASDSGAGGVLGYQWQLSKAGGSVWTNIDGATSNIYTTATVTYADNEHQYRCKVTTTRNGVSAEVFSAAVTLTVKIHRITVIKPNADNDEHNQTSINSGSLVLAQITGEIEGVAAVTIKIDNQAEQTISSSGNTIYYLLPAGLSEGWHTITIKLTNTVSYGIEATVTFYWDSYRRGFGFGRFDFGETDSH